jgi:hypothetical protein
MRVNSQNAADIRFFGAHDRAWIPIRDVYLYSAKPPAGGDAKRKQRGNNNNLDTCFKAGLAIKNPPKKTHTKKHTQKTQKYHLKNPLKMCFFGFFNF